VAGDAALQTRLEVEIDAVRLEAGVDSVELRAAPASDHAAVRAGGFRHVLQLDPNPDNVLQGFKREVRKAIRLAKRSGITVTRAEQEQDLTGIFYGLHTATRRRLGVPVQSRRYFSLIWQRVVERGLGFLLIARVAGQPVAAALFLTLNRTIIAKYSASDAAAWRMRPNNAVFWEAIIWACENGYSTWDFGRTDAVDEGVRTFKRRWGAEEVPLTYGIIGRARRSGLGAPRALRLAGPLIRHTPPFVCREIGRAFYRYAA
jgi:lipid II:glycine glycyltransferase (peptidoglycan interpeptide bridge formation enzyme)